MKSAIIFLFIWSTTLLASELRELPFSKNEKSKVSFKLVKNWKHEKKIIGVDHLFIFERKKSRDLISILISPPGKVSFTMSRDQEQRKYAKQKLKWLKKRGGEINSFIPLKTSVKGTHLLYRFGLRYKVPGRDIIEFSQYHFCKGRLVFIKLLGDSNYSSIQNAEEEIASSFRCE